MKKLDYITVLRGIAILMVLVVHTSQIGTGLQFIHPYIIGLFNNGARGVQLFYLLSAFTLFLSFNNRHAGEKKPIKNYFIRRFFRIAPLYYLAIVYYLWQDGTAHSTANIISNVLFLHGFSPYWINSIVPGSWSIAVEVVFYCLLPFLFYRIKNIQQACIFTFVALGIRLILFVLFSRYKLISDTNLWGDYLFFYLPNQLPVFGLGIILYFIIYDISKTKLSPKFLVAGSVIIVLGMALQPGLFIPDIFYFGLAFLILAYALNRYHPPILFNAIVLYIGKISYTLYLTHWAAIYFLGRYKISNMIPGNNEATALCNFILNYGMVLSLSVLLSSVLYYAIELPCKNLVAE